MCKFEHISHKIRNKARYLLSTFLFTINTSEIRGIQTGNASIKLPLFTDSTTVYAENSKEPKKKKKDTRTTDFSRILEYKVNIKINFMCFSYEQVKIEIKNSEKT